MSDTAYNLHPEDKTITRDDIIKKLKNKAPKDRKQELTDLLNEKSVKVEIAEKILSDLDSYK